LVSIIGDQLILQDETLFGTENATATRRLLELAFSLPEIKSATLRGERGNITFNLAGHAIPRRVWQRLGALLRQSRVPERSREICADRLPLQPPAPGLPVRISRFGQTLTTFRVRTLASERMRIAHPLLRDRDIKTRVLEALSAVHGVVSVRSVRLWGSVIIAYDPPSISPEQLLRFLDDSWAGLMQGPTAPPLPRKLAVAGSLLALSFTAQFFRRALLPWATAAVALYNLPNVIAAIQDLRRRRIGLPAMYTMGFGFLLWFRLPFVSTLFSTLTQAWPALGAHLAIDSGTRLFAPQRRRQIWARLTDDEAGEVEIDVAALRPGMIITARKGDFIPADGTVVEGLASVQETFLTGGRNAADKLPGDPVYAGAYVGDGNISIRVARAGAATASAALAHALPRRPVGDLPSSQEVEHVGHRNARPALLGASLMLLATRVPRYSQVIIRPDYLTGPRLSAHLSALATIAESLAGGALIRNPAALDRLLAADICVLDDSVNLVRRRVQFRDILSENASAASETLRFVGAALAGGDDPRVAALRREAKRRRIYPAQASDYRRQAGAILFRDETGSEIRVMSPLSALQLGMYAPTTAIAAQLKAEAARPQTDPATRSFAVARARNIIGLVRFERAGPLEAADAVAALRIEIPDTRFVYLSSLPQEEAEARALELGLDAVFGGLSVNAKTEVMRSLSTRAVWIGDGTDPSIAPTRAAAAVSVSTAGIDRLAQDSADILLLKGELRALSAARFAAERRLGQLKTDYRTVYLANLAAVAGGFVAGFTSLHAGLTSNFGTAAVFVSRWRALNTLALHNEKTELAQRVGRI
jgi:cation transport ATPase